MEEFIIVKKSQSKNYFATPLYVHNQETGYVLYKPINKKIDKHRYTSDNSPNLYIHANDRQNAKNELRSELRKELIKQINDGEINAVKVALCEMIAETFADDIDASIESLPDTIDIMFEGFSRCSDLLKAFHEVNYAEYPLVNHCANVMTIALLFCIKNNFRESETKRVSLCALLHDVGVTKLSKGLLAYKGRLPDEKYQEYQNHPAIGHDIVKHNEHIDSSIAVGILEHHERLDGTGYPRGIAQISFEGRLVGLIDSFDSLTNCEKIHRPRIKPFDAMRLIKDEVLEKGQFDRAIYRDLCLVFGKKIA